MFDWSIIRAKWTHSSMLPLNSNISFWSDLTFLAALSEPLVYLLSPGKRFYITLYFKAPPPAYGLASDVVWNRGGHSHCSGIIPFLFLFSNPVWKWSYYWSLLKTKIQSSMIVGIESVAGFKSWALLQTGWHTCSLCIMNREEDEAKMTSRRDVYELLVQNRTSFFLPLPLKIIKVITVKNWNQEIRHQHWNWKRNRSNSNNALLTPVCSHCFRWAAPSEGELILSHPDTPPLLLCRPDRDQGGPSIFLPLRRPLLARASQWRRRRPAVGDNRNKAGTLL